MEGVAIDIHNGSAAGDGAQDTTPGGTTLEESPLGNSSPTAAVVGRNLASTSSGTTAAHPTLQRKLSVSQSANEASGGWNAPWFLSFIEYPFHVKDPVDGTKLPEAAGWGMDSAARGPLNQIGGYVGSAIIRLAAKDVGCVSPRGCDIAVRGGILKPSSLLTATSTIVGIVGAILMPFVGAIVDHTTHRKLLGITSGFLVVLVAGLQIMISVEPNNWLFILILDAIGSFGLLVHTTAVFSYLPDLTTDEDSIPKYTAAFTVRQYSAQLVFGTLLLLANKVRGADRSLESAVQTAKDGSGIAFGFGCLFIGYAWLFLFRKRPPLSQVPEGQSLVTTGFVQVKNTSTRIWKNYSALKWFMISLLFSPEAGAGVVLSIVVSFLTVDVKISSTELAYLSLILMACNIVGAILSKWVTRKMNPLNSYRAGLLFLALSIGVSTAIIKGPDDRKAAIGTYEVAWYLDRILRLPANLCYPIFCTPIVRLGLLVGTRDGLAVFLSTGTLLHVNSKGPGSRNDGPFYLHRTDLGMAPPAHCNNHERKWRRTSIWDVGRNRFLRSRCDPDSSYGELPRCCEKGRD